MGYWDPITEVQFYLIAPFPRFVQSFLVVFVLCIYLLVRVPESAFLQIKKVAVFDHKLTE